jgi:spore germination protein (amino acid permease)
MQGQTFLGWLKVKIPAFIVWPLTVVLAVYMFAIALITLKDTVTWARAIYLPHTPAYALSISFTALCLFAAAAGISPIAITSGILLPVVIVLGLFVMTVNFQSKDYTLLFPLFTHGYSPALTGVSYVMGSFSELIVLLFIQQHLAAKVRFVPFMFLALILTGLTIGPLTGSIAMFGPFEAAAQRYPPFELWRMVRIGKFITHLDFLSVYQWLSGAFIRISLALFLIVDLLGIRKKRMAAIVIAAALLLLLSLTPVSDKVVFDSLTVYYYPFSFVIVSIIALGLFVIARMTRTAGTKNVKK